MSCTTSDPNNSNPQLAALRLTPAVNAMVSDAPSGAMTPAAVSYTKFTDQEALGIFLEKHYKIRSPRELTSCEVCHR